MWFIFLPGVEGIWHDLEVFLVVRTGVCALEDPASWQPSQMVAVLPLPTYHWAWRWRRYPLAPHHQLRNILPSTSLKTPPLN